MNFKKMLSLVIAIFLCFSVLSGCGEGKSSSTTTTQTNVQTEKKLIAMLGGSENSGFWQNVKKGAQDVAKKYGYTLNYFPFDEEADNISSQQSSQLDEVLSRNVSGIVITPDGEGYSSVYSKIFDAKTPLVQINNLSEDDLEVLESNKKNPVISTVSSSFRDAGALCAEKLFEKIKEDIQKETEAYVIGVIERDNQEADKEKTEGFIEKFTELADADDSIKGKYKIETESENKYGDSFNQLLQDKAKAVFITDSKIADEVSDIVSVEAEKYNKMIFCGFDSGAKQLKWLEEEGVAEFIGGVAQNAYDLGYNAVEQCIFAVEEKQVKDKVEIQCQWYDKSNIKKLKQEKIVYDN